MYEIGDSVRIGGRLFCVVGFESDGRAILKDDEGQVFRRHI